MGNRPWLTQVDEAAGQIVGGRHPLFLAASVAGLISGLGSVWVPTNHLDVSSEGIVTRIPAAQANVRLPPATP